MKVFAAMYCPCTYESDYGVISLHSTEVGAQKAIDAHRRKQERRFGKLSDWQKHKVEPMQVQP